MTFPKRSILIVWIGLVLFVGILYVLMRSFVLSSALELEAVHTRDDVARIQLAIQRTIDRLGSMNSDWAQWDDSYRFVRDRNRQFIERNLVPVSYTTLNTDLIAYFDTAGRAVYAGYCPCKPDGVTPVPPRLSTMLETVRPGSRGVLVLPRDAPLVGGAPLLVASCSILTSRARGPSRGKLVFGMVLTEQEVKALPGLTRLDTKVERVPGNSLPADFRRAMRHITAAEPVYITTHGDRRVAGYGVMDDIQGNPALMIRVRSPRGIYHAGMALARYVLLGLVVAGLVFGLVTTLTMWWIARREEELEAHKRAFYRSTILAATDGKLVISDPRSIEEIAGPPIASWVLREPEDIGKVRSAIRSVAEAEGMDEDRVAAFLACAGEAVTNAIKHAGGGTASLHRGDDWLLLVVSDKGLGIEATALPDVALRYSYTTAKSLGIGYKVMIELADKIYLATGPTGTTVGVQMGLREPAGKPLPFPQLTEPDA